MKTVWKWILGIGLTAFFLAVLAAAFLLGRFGRIGWGVVKGRAFPFGPGWMDGHGMMGRWFGFYPHMGWLGMGLTWLFQVLLFALVVAGIASLIVSLTRPAKAAMPETATPSASTAAAPAAGRVCQHCGRAAQPDWSHCPYCGQALSS